MIDPILLTYTTADLEAELARRKAISEVELPDPPVPTYRVTLDVIGHNGEVPTVSDLIGAFENLGYPDFVSVVEVRQKDIPVWTDDNPLNQTATAARAADEWFADAPVVWSRGDD